MISDYECDYDRQTMKKFKKFRCVPKTRDELESMSHDDLQHHLELVRKVQHYSDTGEIPSDCESLASSSSASADEVRPFDPTDLGSPDIAHAPLREDIGAEVQTIQAKSFLVRFVCDSMLTRPVV